MTLGWTTVAGRVRAQQPPDRLVYVTSETGELVAFSAATGERQWGFEFATNPEIVSQKGGPPLVWNGTVYLTAQGRLYAVDAATGDREWVFEGRNGGTALPTVHGGVVYLVNYVGTGTALREQGDLEARGNGYLYALDAETGEQLWRTANPMLSISCQAPLVYDGTVFVLGGTLIGGTMSAYDVGTGAKQWGRVSPYGDLQLRIPRYGPVEVDGIIYIMGAQGGILGFDPDTGERVSRAGANGTLVDTPYTPSRGKLSAYGSTLLSADGDRLDRFLPVTESEEDVPGTTQGGVYPFDTVGELEGVKSSFAVGRPALGRHPYLVVGAKRFEGDGGAEGASNARFQATSMNPAIAAPDPEWTYEQPALVNPTVAGRTAYIGGAELTALDLRDGTERWSSDAVESRIVTAPTVVATPKRGHSIDERIRHQTLNHHDMLGTRPASFRVSGGQLSAAGLAHGDEYLFPGNDIEPRMYTADEPRDDGLAYATYDRLVGQVDANGRIVVPRDALEAFRAEHGETAGLIVQIHNIGGETAEKPVEVTLGEMTFETTIPIQGFGIGSLYLFESRAATPEYVRSGSATTSAKTYFGGAARIDFPGEQLLTDDPTELTVSTPDHERTIRFEGVASNDTPEEAASPERTESSTEQSEPVDSAEQETTGASGPGLGVMTGLTAIAVGGYARSAWRTQHDEE
ncbi:outer membrane protein assembly factor BamB family protein [Haloplanus natans]|uniref:outer membrane protein assembly factor BamB family protein n=1 Tax=Haloplanus natans TaxID=376171 RepID=UPI00146FC06B|nr:PQQ-binding-like beta-propeller repeat protein [Haloplanus natans]